MNVAILVTIPDNTSNELCTLCFDTLRVGFPTAKITVYDNNNSTENNAYIREKCNRVGAEYVFFWTKVHHAAWIKGTIENTEGKLCIIDADTLWWSNVEGFDFPTTLAGYYQPYRYCEFAQSSAVQRLHTHFMWIKDCKALRESAVYNYQHEYSPCDPYMPAVVYSNGKPIFYDTCAVLYHMIGGSSFDEKHLDCYDHINSASLYNTLVARIHGKDDLKAIHEMAKTDPSKLKGLYKVVRQYENQMHKLAQAL